MNDRLAELKRGAASPSQVILDVDPESGKNNLAIDNIHTYAIRLIICSGKRGYCYRFKCF